MTAFGTRATVLRIATAAVPGTFADYTGDISKAVITDGESDSDFVTFLDAANGGAREYFLDITMAQDPATTALYAKLWTEVGTDCPFELWPNGRPGTGTASPTQPKYTGTCTISEPDGDFLGGEADKSNTAKFKTDVSWKLLAKPTKVTS